MMGETVADLMNAQPHDDSDGRYSAAQWEFYRAGYQHALLIVLRALKETELRYEMVERTKRLDAKRRRAGK